MSTTLANAVPVPTEAPAVPDGFHAQDAMLEDTYARILLLGAMKVGKTTAVLSTSPGPVAVLNCDGVGATKYPATQGAKFMQIDVRSRATWAKGCASAVKAAKAGQIKTIVVDTVTLLGDEILDELKLLNFQGFDLWNELADSLKSGLRKLLDAPAHLIVIAHMDPREDEVSGIMPLIPGGTKVWLPSKVADWVLFDYADGKRQFLLGPQKMWSHSGRNIKKSEAIEADVCEMFARMGIAE